MKKMFLIINRFLFLYFFLISVSVFSQTKNSRIDPDNFNQDLLSDLINQEVNAARDSLNLDTFERDNRLDDAAQFHAKYLKRRSVLTHREKNYRYATPAKRVRQFGVKYRTVAENIAYASAGPTIIRGNNREFTFKTYQEVAENFANDWLSSPGHFENIAYHGFDQTGIAVSYDKTKNIIFAVQVFVESPEKDQGPIVRKYSP